MKTKHSSSVRRGISFGTIFMTALTVVVIGLSAAVLPRLLGTTDFTHHNGIIFLFCIFGYIQIFLKPLSNF